MSNRRLFVALPLPAPVRAALAPLATPLDGVAWTDPEQLHLTLRFLGDISDEKVRRIVTHLAAVRVEPFVLPLEGLGAFPPKGAPQVLWLGVGRGHPRLHQLRQRIDDALLAAGLHDLEVRTFHPHVTLARCGAATGPGTLRWMQSLRDFAAPPFRADAFVLCSSALHAAGAMHTALECFPLTRETARQRSPAENGPRLAADGTGAATS